MGDTFWFLAEFTYAGVSAFLTYLFMKAFLKKRKDVDISWKIVTIVIVFLAKFIASYGFRESTVIIPSLSFLSAIAIGIICFRDKLRGVAVAGFFQLITGASAELIGAFVVITFQDVSVRGLVEYNIYRIQARTLSYLAYLIIIMLVSRFRNVSIEGMAVRPMVALCAFPLASMIIVQQFAQHLIRYAYAATIQEVIPLASILLVNIFIFVLVENLMRQNEKSRALILAETQGEALTEHLKQFMANQEQVTRMSHDFKHRVITLYALCKEKRYDELLDDLDKLSKKADQAPLVNTDNAMLDAIISYKKVEAEKHHIDLHIDLSVQPNIAYMTIEHCVLLGNALDNAIEACCKCPKDERKINLDLKAIDTAFMFNLTNTFADTPVESNGKFVTSKPGALKHGIGMSSMKRTCELLGGFMAYSYGAKRFKLQINIPISVNRMQ